MGFGTTNPDELAWQAENEYRNDPGPSLEEEAVDQELAKIVTAHLGIETLQLRGSDQLDFREISVNDLRSALLAAYETGRNRGKESLRENTAVLMTALEELELACRTGSTKKALAGARAAMAKVRGS